MTGPRADVRLLLAPDPAAALPFLTQAGGTMALVAPGAKPPGVRLDPTERAEAQLAAAAEQALRTGAQRVLVWQGVGLVAPGRPVAVVGAVAGDRKVALAAVQALLAGLSGVATRTDVLVEP